MPNLLRLTFAVLIIVVAAFALGATAALAAPKEVAYVCHGEDICLLDPANPNATTVNLTDDGTTSYDEDPTWSPDGKHLAFVAKFPGTGQENIYSMEPDAPGETVNEAIQITHFVNGLVPTGELAWSPDGSKIAFVRGAASAGNNPLYVVNADGSSANAIEIPTSGGGGTPTFSADSSKIAYWHGNQIYTVPSDLSGPATALPGASGREPAWSPDGSKIAYGNEFANIKIIGAGGGTPMTISSFSQFAFASWSPSGAQLAYHEQSGENSYFRIVNADGTGNHGLPVVQGLNANGPAPSWSPDGTRLVFQGYYFEGGADTNEVYMANADGSGTVTPLTSNQGNVATDPVWRPNPVTNPGPPVITPSGGSPNTPSSGSSSAPLPGPTIKPQVKWFTNRVIVSEYHYVPMMSVGCGGPSCNVSGEGKSKGAIPAGLAFDRTVPATASAKTKKPKASPVVARGNVFVPSGQTQILKLTLTKLGSAILRQTGRLKMTVTVTTTIASQPPVTESRPIEVVYKSKKPKRKGQ